MQCDSDWEHQYGITISNLDNPGWEIKIDLSWTALETVSFEQIKNKNSEDDWVICRLEDNVFCGFCGPKNLKKVLAIFRDWAMRDTMITDEFLSDNIRNNSLQAIEHIDWRADGKEFHYWFLGDPWSIGGISPGPGNFMFVKPTIDGWAPIFIGIADDVSTAIPGHKLWAKAEKLGATRVMSHLESDADLRKQEMEALIRCWQPPLKS